MNPKKTGFLLQQSREQKQMDIVEVSKRFNVSIEEIQNWESGKSLPQASEIPLLCNMYNITTDEFYAGEKQEAKMTDQKADLLIMFSSVVILAGISSFFLLRSINMEVAILSAILLIAIGVMTLLYVGLKTE